MPHQDAHDKIFEIIYSKTDEITWQHILYDLVKAEHMDPWSIDVSLIANKYIGTLRKLKEHDFRISGKMVLAAAILLKLKSSRLVGEDIDRLIAGAEEEEPELIDSDSPLIPRLEETPTLLPRTPQPRKRKVSIFDLVKALERALEVKKRRVLNSIPPMSMEVPKKPVDITIIIRQVYGKIKALFMSGLKVVNFTQLLPSQSKQDKVHTFIPLVYLENQGKIELEQDEPFGEIKIVVK
ncbi:segregation/condensation protein A [Candidatus Woesearchaeota archaeon]|nr:segregation/condensation protein A [Candidatus Woesearchaeota archaeon]